jgi:hypothetical protein
MNDDAAIVLGVGTTMLILLGVAGLAEYLRLPAGRARTRFERTWLWPAVFAGLAGVGVLVGAVVAATLRA